MRRSGWRVGRWWFPRHSLQRWCGGVAQRPVIAIVSVASAEPAIACFPNPSNANTFVTYPSFLDGTPLLIMDAKGELVRAVMLQNQGVLDLNTRELPAGLYLLTVAGTSFSTKLTVQR